MTENQRQHLIEGYKALMQYGCQLSGDHINYDRIFMPLSLVPAFLVLSSPDIQNSGKQAELSILSGGFLLLLFWFFRNIRSQKRLYKTWETLCCIEKCLGFAAYTIVQDTMKTSWRPADFTLKFIFGVVVALGYIVLFCYVSCR